MNPVVIYDQKNPNKQKKTNAYLKCRKRSLTTLWMFIILFTVFFFFEYGLPLTAHLNLSLYVLDLLMNYSRVIEECRRSPSWPKTRFSWFKLV
jgi:hypothetical protein